MFDLSLHACALLRNRLCLSTNNLVGACRLRHPHPGGVCVRLAQSGMCGDRAARRVERLLTDKSFRLGGTVAGGLENESTVDHSGNAVVRTLPLSIDARRAGTSWAFKQTI